MSETNIPMTTIDDSTNAEMEGCLVEEESQSLSTSKVNKVVVKKQKHYQYKQPETHLKNKSLMAMICSCCGDRFKTDLTYDELISFYKIKELATTTFDSRSTEYDHLFRQLWEAFTEETPHDEIVNERWKEFGFQNQNPKSDFRAAGLFALRQLLRFVSKNRGRTLRMCDSKYDFCFAISSINITYFLIRYYHLAEGMTYERDKQSLCSRIALKTMCQILEQDEEVLDKIHAMLLNDLFEIWIELKKRVKGINLMDFSMAIGTVKRRFIRTTEYCFFTDFDHLRRQYNQKEVDFPTKRPSMMEK
jgi:hypothetical protein